MVKLQETSKGKFRLSVPLTKVKLMKWVKGQEFDPEIDVNGNLVFRPLRR